MGDERETEIADQYQGYISIPYGPQVIREYAHPAKHFDFQGVIHNSKTHDYVILDSRGISTWHAMTPSSRAVKRVMEFEAYKFNTLRCIVYSRFHNLYFGLTKDFSIKVYNLNFHEIYHTDGDGSVYRLLYNNKRNELITICRGKVKCWKYVICEMQPALVLHREFKIDESLLLSSAEFDEELQRIYVLSDCNIYCYSMEGQLHFHLKGHSMAYFCVCAFSREANLLIAGSIDGQLSIYNPTGGLVTTLLNHSKIITAISIHLKDRNMFLSASMDGTVRVFSLQMLDEIYSINVYPEGILFMRTHASDLLYVASRKGVRLYDLNYSFKFWSTARAPVRRMNTTHPVPGNRQYVVVVTTDYCIRLYSKQTSQRRSTVLPPPEIAIGQDVISIAFDRQGRAMYILFEPLQVWIYSTRTDPATRVATWDLYTSIRNDFYHGGRHLRRQQQQQQQQYSACDDETKFGSSRRSRKKAEDNITCCSLVTIRREVFQTEQASSDDDYLNFGLLLCGLSNGEVLFLDPCQSGCVVRSFKAHPTSPVIEMDVDYHHNHPHHQTHLLTILGTVDGLLVRLWDVGTFRCFYQVFLHPNYTQLNYKKLRLVVGLSTGHIQTEAITKENGDVEAVPASHLSSPGKMREHDGSVLSVDISDSMAVFCSSGADHFVRVWNYNKELLSEIKLDDTLKYAIFLTKPERILVSFKSHLFVIPHDVVLKKDSYHGDEEDATDSSGDESVIFEDPFVKGEKLNKAGTSIDLATYLVPYPYLGLESLWMFQKAIDEFTGLEEVAEHGSVTSESSTDSLGSLASTTIYRDSSDDENVVGGNYRDDDDILFPSCSHTPEPRTLIPAANEEGAAIKIFIDEQQFNRSSSSDDSDANNDARNFFSNENLYDRIRKKTDSISDLKYRTFTGSINTHPKETKATKATSKKTSKQRMKKKKTKMSKNLSRELKSKSKIDEFPDDSDSKPEYTQSKTTFTPTQSDNENLSPQRMVPSSNVENLSSQQTDHLQGNVKALKGTLLRLPDNVPNRKNGSGGINHHGRESQSAFSTHHRTFLSLVTGRSERVVSHSYQNVLKSLMSFPTEQNKTDSKASCASSATPTISSDDDDESNLPPRKHPLDTRGEETDQENLKATKIFICSPKKSPSPHKNIHNNNNSKATKEKKPINSTQRHRRNSNNWKASFAKSDPKQQERQQQQKTSVPNSLEGEKNSTQSRIAKKISASKPVFHGNAKKNVSKMDEDVSQVEVEDRTDSSFFKSGSDSRLSSTIPPNEACVFSQSTSEQRPSENRNVSPSGPALQKPSYPISSKGSNGVGRKVSHKASAPPTSPEKKDERRSSQVKKSLRSITEKHLLSQSSSSSAKDLFADLILYLHAKARRKRMILKANISTDPLEPNSSVSSSPPPPPLKKDIITVEIRPSQTDLQLCDRSNEEERKEHNNNLSSSYQPSQRFEAAEKSKQTEQKTTTLVGNLDGDILKISPVKAVDHHHHHHGEEHSAPSLTSEESKDVVKFILSSFKKPTSPVKPDKVKFKLGDSEVIETVESAQALKRSNPDSPANIVRSDTSRYHVSPAQSNQSDVMSPVTCVIMQRHPSEMMTSDDSMEMDSSDSLLGLLNRHKLSKQRRRERYQIVQNKRSSMSGYETCSRDSMTRSPGKETTFKSTSSHHQSPTKQRLSIRHGPLHQHHRQAPKSAIANNNTTSEIVYYEGYLSAAKIAAIPPSKPTTTAHSHQRQAISSATSTRIEKHEIIRDLEKKLSGQKHRCFTPKSESEMEVDRLTLLMMKKKTGVKVPVARSSSSIPVRCHYKLVKNPAPCS